MIFFPVTDIGCSCTFCQRKILYSSRQIRLQMFFTLVINSVNNKTAKTMGINTIIANNVSRRTNLECCSFKMRKIEAQCYRSAL